MPSLIKRVKGFVEKKRAERKVYGAIEKTAKEKREAARLAAYHKESMRVAEQRGKEEGVRQARGEPSGRALQARQAISSGFGKLSAGSAKALESGMYGMGDGDIFKGLEEATGAGGMGAGTLENIEVVTGVSKRKARKTLEQPLGRGGQHVTVYVGGAKRTRRKGVKKQARRRDWQDDIEELTGF